MEKLEEILSKKTLDRLQSLLKSNQISQILSSINEIRNKGN